MKEMIKLLSNLEWFLKMVNENPDLPVIPIVSDEVIDDDFKLMSSNRYMGSLGDAEILMYIKGNKSISLYGDCSYIETLVDCGKFTRDECEKLSAEELENEYNNLPWQKAIFVKIDWFE